jgi:uncharacterized protein YjaG (DUF416 family)
MRSLGQHTLLGIVVDYGEVSGNTLYRESLGLMWAAFIWVQNNIFFKNNSGKVEANIPSQKNHLSLLPGFLN